MKAKRFLLMAGAVLMMVTLMSTTCSKTDDPQNPDCSGYIQATATGNINQSYCFDDNPQYVYDEENERLNFSAIVTIDGVIYGCDVSVMPFTVGTQNYVCGFDVPGGVELILHGDNQEFYQSQSGSLTITEADATHLKATFNVVTKGYNNGKTVNLQGSVNYSGS